MSLRREFRAGWSLFRRDMLKLFRDRARIISSLMQPILFLGIFGGGALLLAALGIYGLISYSVSQRERELGLRIALGATPGEIRRSVVGDGLRLTFIGLAIGLAAALGLGQLISAFLFGVSPFDPVTLGTVAALFTVVAVVASSVPAARACRTDPIGALRSD